MDADDYIAPSALAKMFSIATKTSAVIVACEYYTCKNADRVASKFLNDRDVKIYSGDERINVIRSCIESRAYGNTQVLRISGFHGLNYIGGRLCRENGLILN